MKNTIKFTAVTVIAGAALAVAGTGAAHADLGDEFGFLNFVTDHGLYMDGENAAGRMLASGYWVCQNLSTHSSLDMVRYIYRHTNDSIDTSDASAIVAAAEAYLCPTYLNTPVDQPGVSGGNSIV